MCDACGSEDAPEDAPEDVELVAGPWVDEPSGDWFIRYFLDDDGGPDTDGPVAAEAWVKAPGVVMWDADDSDGQCSTLVEAKAEADAYLQENGVELS